MENPNQNEQPKTLPSREEVIKWYQEQIEVAELRARLAELQSKATQEDAKRIQATILIAQMQAPPQPEGEETEETEEQSAPKTRTLKREK